MADELSFLTINADTTSWVDFSPGSEETGYQAQNTNIEARNLGQDDTSISISGTNITLDPSGVIDDDGLPIVINSAVTLPVGSDGDWYIKVIAGSTATQRSLTLQSGGGTWDTSKQGYYDTGDRVLNWKITRASGVLKLFKRTKPNEGLELNGDITATQADVTTVNATEVNATTGNITTVNSTTVGATTGNITTVDSTTGNITTVNATTVGADTGNITTVNATTVSATGVVTGSSFNSGNGATELYDMDQDMKTTDNVTHNDLSLTGSLNPKALGLEGSWTETNNSILIPRGCYNIQLTPSGSATVGYIEMYVNGSWTVIANSGTVSGYGVAGISIFSDGVNLRFRALNGTVTARYLKF